MLLTATLLSNCKHLRTVQWIRATVAISFLLLHRTLFLLREAAATASSSLIPMPKLKILAGCGWLLPLRVPAPFVI